VSERRRRRPDDDSRGGLPLFPLVLVVILAGLLLGGVLAHFFGGPKAEPLPKQTAIAALPSPPATPEATPTAPPKVSPRPSPSMTPTPLPTSSSTPKAVVAAVRATSPKPKPLASLQSSNPPTTPAPMRTQAPVPKASSPAPKSVVAAVSETHAPASSNDDRAAALVRSYLEALARGDRAAASSYLSGGSPNETFMTPEARIESIRSSNVGPQQYRVTADVQTAGGEYYITFTVEQNPAGLAITDHFSIKTQ
jgi:hypothetical protein